MGHKAADEMDVSAQAVELCRNDRGCDFLGRLQGCSKRRSPAEGIGPFPGLNLLERLNQVKALSLGKPEGRGLLRFKRLTGLAPLCDGNSGVGHCLFHLPIIS
jgi:hypothetical protein